MAGERYNEEFKIATVKHVTEQNHSISDVANEKLWKNSEIGMVEPMADQI